MMREDTGSSFGMLNKTGTIIEFNIAGTGEATVLTCTTHTQQESTNPIDPHLDLFKTESFMREHRIVSKHDYFLKEAEN